MTNQPRTEVDNTDMNDWIRRARNRNRWTSTPEGIEVHDAEPEPEVTEEVVDGPPKVPDLGQGARGLSPQPRDFSSDLRRQMEWKRDGWHKTIPPDFDAA